MLPREVVKCNVAGHVPPPNVPGLRPPILRQTRACLRRYVRIVRRILGVAHDCDFKRLEQQRGTCERLRLRRMITGRWSDEGYGTTGSLGR
jgi:hypothetical protein